MNQNKKIMIVDDDEDLQDVMKNALEIEGYEVLVANDGQDALDILNALPNPTDVNCIILDLMMPIMDGTEMLAKLQADPKLKEIPVVISTAKGKVDQLDHISAQAVIKKPMKISALYDIVKKYSTKPKYHN